MAYAGLPEKLRREVLERDHLRCRWCGATNQGGDLHHIEYRRGTSYDRLDNLVTLCRLHHGFAHGIPLGNGERIVKQVAQAVLTRTINFPGSTGASNWRQMKREWANQGLCQHAYSPEGCPYFNGSS